MWAWEDVKMSRCVKMWRLYQMWRWEDVKITRCEDEKMRKWEDVRMRRCDDEKMGDEQMWRWEDVKMWGCENVKMWGWEDVKMRKCFYRPPLLEEPCTQTLSGKRSSGKALMHELAKPHAYFHSVYLNSPKHVRNSSIKLPILRIQTYNTDIIPNQPPPPFSTPTFPSSCNKPHA